MKEKMYNPIECDSFQMQFGFGMAAKKNNSKYIHKKKYYFKDKITNNEELVKNKNK